MTFDLWPRPYWPKAFRGKAMRLKDDVRKSVIFIGTGKADEFSPFGTAFLVLYNRIPYLITARHVAHAIGDDPCTIRVNDANGIDPIDIEYDPTEDLNYFWRFHPDETVDAAVMLFRIDLRAAGADFRYLPENMIADESKLDPENIGVGDFCYTVGLFRLLSGKNRNLPFVHTGHIGMLPDDERVPIQHWSREKGVPPLQAEAFLVENNSLDGLSGSPVFVRASTVLEVPPKEEGGRRRDLLVPDDPFWLLGLWQGAWKGDPDQILKDELRSKGPVRVAVGVGAVIPATKIVEILESPDVISDRDEFLAGLDADGASTPD